MHKRFEELNLAGNLPSPSGVGLAILHHTQNDETRIEDLVRILQTDPALTGRVLKLANSAQRADTEPVTKVTQAAARLGARAVREVALGFTLLSSNRAGMCARFDYDHYWSFSLACAIAAQSLARRLSVCDPDEAFTCGLLSRAGTLALACVHPEAYSKILAEQEEHSDFDVLSAESRAFEINRWEVTAAMLTECGLPKVFASAILTLSQPDAEAAAYLAESVEVGEVGPLRWILGAAGRMADLLLRDLEVIQADPVRAVHELETVRGDLPLETSEVARLCQETDRHWRERSALLRIPTISDGALNAVYAGSPSFDSEGEEPVAAEPEAVSWGDEGAGDVAVESKPIKVLVVDDDERLVRLISLHLRRSGYEVITATDGRTGLETALREGPEIVVTDWMMPELSGIELCQALRSREARRFTYVLMLTAREDEDRIVDAFDAGADDYVIKPFNPRIFLARVQAGHRMIELQHKVEADKRVRTKQVREMELLTSKLRTAALTDVLTGLPNRRQALTLLEQAWADSVALERPLSLVMIDVDHFKRINDEHGHDVGDHVLRSTAKVLREKTRRRDVVCRMGGEEFLVINVDCDLRSALVSAERLRTAVEANRIEYRKYQGSVTISLGVSERTASVHDIDELLRTVDDAVYRAKSAGRNTIRETRTPSDIPRSA